MELFFLTEAEDTWCSKQRAIMISMEEFYCGNTAKANAESQRDERGNFSLSEWVVCIGAPFHKRSSLIPASSGWRESIAYLVSQVLSCSRFPPLRHT